MISRRGALAALGSICAWLYGSPASGAQGPAMFVVFDSVDAVVLRYRGRQIVVHPQEIMDAIGGPMTPPPPVQQYKR